MKEINGKKSLVFGVIVLFLGFTFSSAIGASDTLTNNIRQDTADEYPDTSYIDVEVVEYKSDGSTVTKYVPILKSDLSSLKKEMSASHTKHEHFSVLKRYNLIPRDVSPTDLELGMEEAAEKFGMTRETIRNIGTILDENNALLPILPPVSLTFFSYTYAAFIFGNSVRAGLSPIMMPFIRLFDNLLSEYFGFVPPAIDITDMAWGLITAVLTEGPTGIHMLALFPGAMACVGFVGYAVKAVPFLVHAFYGFSVMTFTAGIGFHVYEP